MSQEEFLKVIGVVVGSAYFVWLMVDAARTGVFRSPGAGRPIHRDDNPAMFAGAFVLSSIGILVAAIVVVMTIRHSGAP